MVCILSLPQESSRRFAEANSSSERMPSSSNFDNSLISCAFVGTGDVELRRLRRATCALIGTGGVALVTEFLASKIRFFNSSNRGCCFFVEHDGVLVLHGIENTSFGFRTTWVRELDIPRGRPSNRLQLNRRDRRYRNLFVTLTTLMIQQCPKTTRVPDNYPSVVEFYRDTTFSFAHKGFFVFCHTRYPYDLRRSLGLSCQSSASLLDHVQGH